MNYAGWKYFQQNGVNVGIQSPDGRQSILLVDPEVSKWLAAGGAPLAADPPTLQQVKDRLVAVAQKILDDRAKMKGYDTARSCISYLNSTNATWKSDASAMNSWRDAVWNWCFANQSSVTVTTTDAQFTTALLAACPAPW